MPTGFRTYVGAFHVHTTPGGDPRQSLEKMLEAARAASIDFVVLTDHGMRGNGLDVGEGWHDGVLLMVGEEVVTPEAHLLALEMREEVGSVASLRDALHIIRRQNGLAVSIHHHFFDNPDQKGPAPIPPPLSLEDSDLLEMWSFTDEFLVRANSRHVVQALEKPEKLLRGPSRRFLWRWDRALAQRRLAVVGGLNVHDRKDPLLEWRVIFPYQLAFRSVVTCVLAPDLPKVDVRARDLMWNALREGRSYIVNRGIGSEQGFMFEFHGGGTRVRLQGEDAPYDPQGRFLIRTPAEAEVVLRHNGQPMFWGTSREMTFPNAGPGAYRVEVFLNRRLWILSNAIRLVDEEGAIQPTVSDVT